MKAAARWNAQFLLQASRRGAQATTTTAQCGHHQHHGLSASASPAPSRSCSPLGLYYSTAAPTVASSANIGGELSGIDAFDTATAAAAAWEHHAYAAAIRSGLVAPQRHNSCPAAVGVALSLDSWVLHGVYVADAEPHIRHAQDAGIIATTGPEKAAARRAHTLRRHKSAGIPGDHAEADIAGHSGLSSQQHPRGGHSRAVAAAEGRDAAVSDTTAGQAPCCISQSPALPRARSWHGSGASRAQHATPRRNCSWSAGSTLSDDSHDAAAAKDDRASASGFAKSSRVTLQRHSHANRFAVRRSREIAQQAQLYFTPRDADRKARFYQDWWRAAFETTGNDVYDALLADMRDSSGNNPGLGMARRGPGVVADFSVGGDDGDFEFDLGALDPEGPMPIVSAA